MDCLAAKQGLIVDCHAAATCWATAWCWWCRADQLRPVTIGKGTDFLALLGPGGRLATGDPAHVPVGHLCRQALTALGQWERGRAAAGARRGRARGAAAGGARRGARWASSMPPTPRWRQGVAVAGTFPADSHDPITYPFAVTARRRHPRRPGAARLPRRPAGDARCSRQRGFTTVRALITGLLTPDEWEAVRLTLRWRRGRSGSACRWRWLTAWVLARCRFPGRAALDAVVHLPLVLPPVVMGWLLLLVFGVRGPVGALLHDWFGMRLVFTTAGAGAGLRGDAFPADGARDPPVAGGGRSAGWSRRRARWAPAASTASSTVTLPLAAPGILVGGIVGYATCLGEFGAVITFAANIPGETQTLPLAIYAALQVPGGEAAAARAVAGLVRAAAGRAAALGVGGPAAAGAGSADDAEVALRHRFPSIRARRRLRGAAARA